MLVNNAISGFKAVVARPIIGEAAGLAAISVNAGQPVGGCFRPQAFAGGCAIDRQITIGPIASPIIIEGQINECS